MKLREGVCVLPLGAFLFRNGTSEGKKVDTNDNELCFLSMREATGKKGGLWTEKEYLCKQGRGWRRRKAKIRAGGLFAVAECNL